MSVALAQAIGNIRNDPNVGGYDEASVRQVVVLQILSALGWNQFDRGEVTPEFGVGGGLVDYSLQIDGQPKVFIEVKRGGENLSPHQDQLLGYSFGRGVGLATLTNGLDWWFYLPLQEGLWEERRFSAISITSTNEDEARSVFNNALSKSGVASGSAVEYGEGLLERQRQAILVNATLPNAWQALISEPDGLLVDLLAEKSERIAGVKPSDLQVRRFLRDMVARSSTAAPASETTNIPNAPSIHTPRTTVPNRPVRVGSRRNPRPTEFAFLGSRYPVTTWKDVLQKFSEIVYERHPDTFEERVTTLRGRSKIYYSRNQSDLNQPRPVGASGFFLETQWTAQAIRERCAQLATAFGYNESDIEFL